VVGYCCTEKWLMVFLREISVAHAERNIAVLFGGNLIGTISARLHNFPQLII
jgi:hypothetical protein